VVNLIPCQNRVFDDLLSILLLFSYKVHQFGFLEKLRKVKQKLLYRALVNYHIFGYCGGRVFIDWPKHGVIFAAVLLFSKNSDNYVDFLVLFHFKILCLAGFSSKFYWKYVWLLFFFLLFFILLVFILLNDGSRSWFGLNRQKCRLYFAIFQRYHPSELDFA